MIPLLCFTDRPTIRALRNLGMSDLEHKALHDNLNSLFYEFREKIIKRDQSSNFKDCDSSCDLKVNKIVKAQLTLMVRGNTFLDGDYTDDNTDIQKKVVWYNMKSTTSVTEFVFKICEPSALNTEEEITKALTKLFLYTHRDLRGVVEGMEVITYEGKSEFPKKF
jgi:hypothetical protein